MSVYFDFNDWWVGYYRGDSHHYVCLIPTLVIRWSRKGPSLSLRLHWLRRRWQRRGHGLGFIACLITKHQWYEDFDAFHCDRCHAWSPN